MRRIEGSSTFMECVRTEVQAMGSYEKKVAELNKKIEECQAEMAAWIETGEGDPKYIYEDMLKLQYESKKMVVPMDDPTGMEGFADFEIAANMACNGCYLEQCDDLCQREWMLNQWSNQALSYQPGDDVDCLKHWQNMQKKAYECEQKGGEPFDFGPMLAYEPFATQLGLEAEAYKDYDKKGAEYQVKFDEKAAKLNQWLSECKDCEKVYDEIRKACYEMDRLFYPLVTRPDGL